MLKHILLAVFLLIQITTQKPIFSILGNDSTFLPMIKIDNHSPVRVTVQSVRGRHAEARDVIRDVSSGTGAETEAGDFSEFTEEAGDVVSEISSGIRSFLTDVFS
ncbi:hypothetical protein QYM36_007622 [Artemia franciscana]|uniref:Uncharacterized protein n=1 Tax=Artemia franciscana TaxID=6661 RepID=A0AA88LD08_ARTSF|nr:hypothetical protein QYM36_007622 [Artemia franciscana]